MSTESKEDKAEQPQEIKVSSAKPVIVPYLDMDIRHLSCMQTPEPTEHHETGEATANSAFIEENEEIPVEVENADTDENNANEQEVDNEESENVSYSEQDTESVWASASNEYGFEEKIYLGEWTITAYCPCEICCGEWATGCTASGVLATSNHTVACGILPFGTQIMIDDQIYTVEDTGVEGEWIDIFFDSHEEALAFGMQTKSVYLIG